MLAQGRFVNLVFVGGVILPAAPPNGVAADTKHGTNRARTTTQT